MLASAALPIPGTPLVIAAGALTRQGLLNGSAVFTWSFIGIVAGDVISYGLGRFAGDWAEGHIGKRFGDAWQKAQDRFNQYGGLAIFLSRFILNSIDVPTNLIAGASHYDIKRYLLFVFSGRFIWLLIYGSIGYAVGSQYQLISRLISRYAFWIGIIFVLGIIIFLLVRSKRNRTTEVETTIQPVDQSDGTD